jgi:predicted ATPase
MSATLYGCPVEISHVRVEAFKSLYDVECDLDRLTVLTGPNGSGKSNLVDALNFIGEVYAEGLEFAVSRAGGYDNIAHRRSRRAKRPIAFTLEIDIDRNDLRNSPNGLFRISPRNLPDNFRMTYRHRFALQTSGQSIASDYKVVQDVVELEMSGEVVFRHSREGTETSFFVEPTDLVKSLVEPFGDDRYGDLFSIRGIRPTSLVTERYDFPNILWAVTHAVAGTRIFQLSPHQVRRPGVPTPNAALERHGENLPGAANHLRRNDPSAWERVEYAMRAIIPDLTGIDVVYTEDRRLALQFRERGLGRPWNTNEVSDGTIQALAMFTALYDRRSLLLVVEEPENSVHPWILRQFVDFCLGTANKQILLTTHSPVLLNYVDPGIVRLVTLFDGKSDVSRLIDIAPELGAAVMDGSVGLFDFYDSGALTQAVPRGLSPDSTESDQAPN